VAAAESFVTFMIFTIPAVIFKIIHDQERQDQVSTHKSEQVCIRITQVKPVQQ